jgi:hypothetical protein
VHTHTVPVTFNHVVVILEATTAVVMIDCIRLARIARLPMPVELAVVEEMVPLDGRVRLRTEGVHLVYGYSV